MVKTTPLAGCQVIFLCKSMKFTSVYARRCYLFVSVLQHEFCFIDTKFIFFRNNFIDYSRILAVRDFLVLVWFFVFPQIKVACF